MSKEGESLSIEDYMAQGFTRVQAIKKHYEGLKQHGGKNSQTASADTNKEQLQKRYNEIQKVCKYVFYFCLGTQHFNNSLL